MNKPTESLLPLKGNEKQLVEVAMGSLNPNMLAADVIDLVYSFLAFKPETMSIDKT